MYPIRHRLCAFPVPEHVSDGIHIRRYRIILTIFSLLTFFSVSVNRNFVRIYYKRGTLTGWKAWRFWYQDSDVFFDRIFSFFTIVADKKLVYAKIYCHEIVNVESSCYNWSSGVIFGGLERPKAVLFYPPFTFH